MYSHKKNILNITPAIIIILCSILHAQIIVPDISNEYPRVFMQQSDIDVMNSRISQKAEPWHSAWLDKKGSADTNINYVASPYTGRDSSVFYDQAMTQGVIARDLALAYQATGNNVYAQTAINILNAWATATPQPASDFDPEIRYPNTGMEVARCSIQMIWAYDLLHEHPLMTTAIKQNMDDWMRVLEGVIKEGINRWESNDYFGQQYYQNHLVAHAMGLMAIGYVLGDKELVQYATDSPENPRDFVELIEGCILMEGDDQYSYDEAEWPVHDGEIIDRYRHIQVTDGEWTPHGLGYCNLTLNLLTLTAEMAFVNGLDFYSYTAPGGENLLLPFEYYSEFYIQEDACIKDGFYCGEEVSRSVVGYYELANKRYPNNPAITKYLNSVGRSHQRTYYIGTPVLTHGEDIGVRPDMVIANWDMNSKDTFTYLNETRNYIPDNSEYNHKFVLGYTSAGSTFSGASLSADGTGASGQSGDTALWFNGIYSAAFAPSAWPDADNILLEFDLLPYSFSSDQTVIYVTSSWEIRLSQTTGSNARLMLITYHDSGAIIAYSSYSLNLSEWNHITAWVGNGNAYISVNGESGSAVNMPILSTSQNSNIYFGTTHLFNTRFLSGRLDNVKISYEANSCGLNGYSSADFNKDCYVDLLDLATIASQWAKCTDPTSDNCKKE